MSTTVSALSVTGLTVGYARRRGSSIVVRNVDLSLQPGSILGLVGESGCGKSTTALAAIGYRAPGANILNGASHLGDKNLLTLPKRALRRVWGSQVSYVAQNAGTSINPALRIGNQLREVLRVHSKLRGTALKKRQIEILAAVALPDPELALRKYPHQLSGGQQQRVALALALSCGPSVLILDEPTTGLDVTTQARISSLIRSLVRDTSVAALYVSHDLALVATLADRVAVMYAGEIVESGPISAINRPRHPYTQALVRSLPSASERRIVSGLPGEPPGHVIENACGFAPRCSLATERCTTASVAPITLASQHEVRCIRVSETGEWSPPRVLHEATGDAVTESPPLLQVENLECVYGLGRRAFPAVTDVSFTLGVGDTLGVVGESGSGKSTLLRAIAGLHAPHHGSISLRGTPLAPTAARRSVAVRRDIQIVFQDPGSSLNPRQHVAQLISRPLSLFRRDLTSHADRDRVVSELMESVKLPSALRWRYPWELSGGQQQRVAIARAFAAKPQLVLCDEVTSALDVSVQATIIELISDLAASQGVGVLFVTHDLAVVRTVASRTLVMNKGVVCEQGRTEDIFSAPTDPYTIALLRSIPDFRVDEARRPVTGSIP